MRKASHCAHPAERAAERRPAGDAGAPVSESPPAATTDQPSARTATTPPSEPAAAADKTHQTTATHLPARPASPATNDHSVDAAHVAKSGASTKEQTTANRICAVGAAPESSGPARYAETSTRPTHVLPFRSAYRVARRGRCWSPTCSNCLRERTDTPTKQPMTSSAKSF